MHPGESLLLSVDKIHNHARIVISAMLRRVIKMPDVEELFDFVEAVVCPGGVKHKMARVHVCSSLAAVQVNRVAIHEQPLIQNLKLHRLEQLLLCQRVPEDLILCARNMAPRFPQGRGKQLGDAVRSHEQEARIARAEVVISAVVTHCQIRIDLAQQIIDWVSVPDDVDILQQYSPIQMDQVVDCSHGEQVDVEVAARRIETGSFFRDAAQ